MPIYCRGIRGATTASANTPEAILEATRELLQLIIDANDLDSANIGSAIFTTTPDLDATFPARAARDLGWTDAALLCTHEMAVPGALGKVVRVLIHLNTERGMDEVVHLYLKDAWQLRPDREGSKVTGH